MKSIRIILWVVITLVIVGAIGFAASKFLVERDFIIYANVDCDPSVESCFIGDGEFTPQYYKSISRPANTIPACNAWNDECAPLSCDDGHELCEEVLCDPELGEECFVEQSTE